MNRFILAFLLSSGFVLVQGCTGTRRFGTTLERDEKNPCIINMVVQVGIQGTDADVEAVKADLESCYGRDCFIPCPGDSAKGCKTKIKIVVKKWASLDEDEQRAFHYVQMVDNDGLPSTAYIGKPNSTDNTGSCIWRRNANPGTYCHEVLHLCGLYDKYCARLFDPVTGTIITERNCDPPPDPNSGQCCIADRDLKRCTIPCAGHEDDIMGSGFAVLDCENIRDVLKGAGLDNCPPECCGSDSTFARPTAEYYIIPGYLNFGEKNNKLGHLGIGVGYNHYISPSIGITIDAGIYTKTEKGEGFKETSRLIKVTGGGSWQSAPGHRGPVFSTHVMAGILQHWQRRLVTDVGSRSNKTFFCMDIGAALNWRLNRSWSVRVLQADYLPVFSEDNTTHNFRLSAGIVRHLGR